MTKRIPLADGDEYDALTPWKRFHRWRAGDRKQIKRGYWRRFRRMIRLTLRIEQRDWA